MPAPLNLLNKKFERLTVVELLPEKRFGMLTWLCRCECGNQISVPTSYLTCGQTKSCGCLKREKDRSSKNRTHGHTVNRKSRNRTYIAWISMKQRCLNPNATGFNRYGGKGIQIDPSWVQSYEAFLADMGEKPKGTSLDRIDNTKGYFKENCRWATVDIQNQNKTTNRYITIGDLTKTLAEWSRDFNIHEDTVRRRIKNGWTVLKALATPARKYHRRGKCA